MKRIALSTLALLASLAGAHAASGSFSIVVAPPVVVSATVTCAQAALTAPVAAGTVVCPITVAPAGWSGVLALTGTNASSFAISGTNLVVGSTALAAGSYSVTITATP